MKQPTDFEIEVYEALDAEVDYLLARGGIPSAHIQHLVAGLDKFRAAYPEQFPTGTCIFCGCTDAQACEPPCSWINDAHTICSSRECMARGGYPEEAVALAHAGTLLALGGAH